VTSRYQALDDNDVDQFLTQGFVAVRGCFSRQAAEEFTRPVWDRLGYAADAPSTWADDNEKDLDLGSLSPAVVGDSIVIAGKRGVGYVLDPKHLGGIGGQRGRSEICRAFGGTAVSGTTIFVPCRDGIRSATVAGVSTSAVSSASTPRMIVLSVSSSSTDTSRLACAVSIEIWSTGAAASSARNS